MPTPFPATARIYDYALIDVFAARALEGNQLAVFPDARGLTTDEMQALARETNLSETTFILPCDDPAQETAQGGIRVRIFTTEEELPFAGHPTLGTATWLWYTHPTLAGADKINLRLNVGPVPVTFQPPVQGEPGVFATMRQNDPSFGPAHDPAEVAKALGLAIDDLDLRHPIETASTGMGFPIVLLKSLEALTRLNIPQQLAGPYLKAHDSRFFYVLAPAPEGSGVQFRARMQFYGGEDPATGSACGCAISWLVRHGLAQSGAETVIEQGIEMRRPSRLHARATLSGETVHDVFVGGRTVPVATGRVFLP